MSATTPPRDANEAAARLEVRIGRLMVWGVYTAMALIVIGLALGFAQGIDPLAHGRVPAFDLPAVLGSVGRLQPEGFLWAGIVLIIAIPIGRVIVSGIGFLASGERRFAFISLLVLLVVLASVLAALRLEG